MLIPTRRKDRDKMLKRGSPYRGMLAAVARQLGCDGSLPRQVWHGHGKSARVRAAIEAEISKRLLAVGHPGLPACPSACERLV
jgi:hypothetical protein